MYVHERGLILEDTTINKQVQLNEHRTPEKNL
jgi:hypothetical protein